MPFLDTAAISRAELQLVRLILASLLVIGLITFVPLATAIVNQAAESTETQAGASAIKPAEKSAPSRPAPDQNRH